MSLQTLALSILTAVGLAACSGAGSNSTPPQVAQQSDAPLATGTLTIIVPETPASDLRKALYISSATTQAALFIDGVAAAAGSSVSCSSGCTIAYTTTAGSHTFRAETANVSNIILDAAAKVVTVNAGPNNNFTMTLNGDATTASWVSNTTSTTNSQSGTYSIKDSSGNLITSAPAGASLAFDNTPITFATSTAGGFTGTASFTTSGSATTLSAPDAAGNDYPFTATCSASANGTFTITASSAASAAALSAGQLSNVSEAYPSSTLNVAAMHAYSCTSGTISDTSATSSTHWDPTHTGANIALSGSNLVAAGTSGGGVWNGSIATTGKSSGKWYWEITINNGADGVSGGNQIFIGVDSASATVNNSSGGGTFIGQDGAGYAYYGNSGNVWHANGPNTFGPTYTTGDVIGVAMDLTSGAASITFYKNNVNEGTPYTTTNQNFGSVTPLYPAISLYHTNDQITANFGPSFKYTPPAGFSALP